MKKVYSFMALLGAMLAGVLTAFASGEGVSSGRTGDDEANVFITVDNPDAVKINVGWDGTELTVKEGRNAFFIEPYENVMITARSNYEIVDVQGEGVFGFDGVYSLLPYEDEVYDLSITTRKLATKKFSLNLDDASRIEARYLGKAIGLKDGMNEIDLVEMATLSLKALDGYCITEANGFEYDPVSEVWSRYITNQDDNTVFDVFTGIYSPDYHTASLNVISDPEMFSLYLDGEEVTLHTGLQSLHFTEYHNHCIIKLLPGACQRADILVNGQRKNVLGNEIEFDINEGDELSVELFEEASSRHITLIVDDPTRLGARNGLSGRALDLKAGENELDCSEYSVYEFRAAQDCVILDTEGGFTANEMDSECLSIVLNGNEAGNIYSLTTGEIVREYQHATLRISQPEKMRVVRIGANYFDAIDGDIDLRWEKGKLNQLYLGMNVEPTELAVLKVNGEIASDGEWADHFYVLLQEGDVVEVDFTSYDLYHDVTLVTDGPREGFEVYSGDTPLEGDVFHLLHETEIMIVPVKGFLITSVKVDNVSLDREEDGTYLLPAVTGNHKLVVRVYKEYYINALDTPDGSVEIFIIDEESGDLVKSVIAREGDSIYLFHREADEIMFNGFTVNGLEIPGNSFTVSSELTTADGHTILVESAKPSGSSEIEVPMDRTGVERVFTLEGQEVNPNLPLKAGVYIVITEKGVFKVMVD